MKDCYTNLICENNLTVSESQKALSYTFEREKGNGMKTVKIRLLFMIFMTLVSLLAA